MGQLLHGSARTTAAGRRAIQHRHESLAKLAARDALPPKTIATWKQRPDGPEAPMGPQPPHATVLTKAAEALIMAFRRPTRLPLTACLYALPAPMPHLTCSALHRCVKRHGISRLPALEGDKPQKKTFPRSPIGSFPLDIAEVRPEDGTRSRLGAIERPGTWAWAARPADATTMVAAQGLRHVMATVPKKIHTGLTDHGLQVTNRTRDGSAFPQRLDGVWQADGIDQRRPTTHHSWTTGPVERMTRTLTDATVPKDDDQTHHHLKEHL